MAQNPLLGSRISLISKKNIRYEGTLYSINEANATVALQNVRSYGTEGREQLDPETSFVAPQDAVHPYLLFRGCDIKDLHVHETTTEKPAFDDPAIVAAPAAADLPPPPPPPPAVPSSQPQSQQPRTAAAAAAAVTASSKEAPSVDEKENESKKGQGNKSQPPQQPQSQGGRGGAGNVNRRPRKPNPANQIGTGASLLNRKARGTVEGIGPETPQEEFDFQSKLEEFEKEPDDEEEAGDLPEGHSAYDKDDFFDSISCDALDREKGIDNRLRGAQERNLNTETFGAVALNSQRRRRGRGGNPTNGRGGEGSFGNGAGNGGRGGGRGGRGRGPGRGRGRGRGRGGGRGEGGGRGRGGRYNSTVRTESD